MLCQSGLCCGPRPVERGPSIAVSAKRPLEQSLEHPLYRARNEKSGGGLHRNLWVNAGGEPVAEKASSNRVARKRRWSPFESRSEE